MMKFAFWERGPKKARCLLFLHGYPDDHSLWNNTIESFEKSFRCLAVDFPNSSPDSAAVGDDVSFEHLAKTLVESLASQMDRDDWRVTLVCHDWGAMYAYEFTRLFPSRVEAIVAVDVGASVSEQKNPLGYVIAPTYQLNLAGAYLATKVPFVGLPLATAWSKGVLAGLRSLDRALSHRPLKGGCRTSPFTPLQNFSYWEFVKRLTVARRKGVHGAGLPRVPILFVYGTQGLKRAMQFHDRRWLKFVESTPGGRVVAFEESGHWPMLDEPERFSRVMREFLD